MGNFIRDRIESISEADHHLLNAVGATGLALVFGSAEVLRMRQGKPNQSLAAPLGFSVMSGIAYDEFMRFREARQAEETVEIN
jgi:hypothetical protein